MFGSKESFLEAALNYAKMGIPVFPLHRPTANGECSCRKKCVHIGKHPRTKNGLKDATTEENIIREWANKNPDSNIGLRTGGISKLIVVDFDPKNGGLNSKRILEERFGMLPKTVKVFTGRDETDIRGEHHYYILPPSLTVGNIVGLLPGVDIRCEDGYVVGAPSVHKSGVNYELAADAPENFALIPDFILDLIKENKTEKRAHSNTEQEFFDCGQRNEKLFKLACSLVNKNLSRTGLEATLLSENKVRCRPPLDENEVIQILESALRYGTQSEKYPPPLSHDAFWGLSGDIVRAIEPHTESDPAAILMQFIVAFGSLIGRNIYYQVEADKHFTNLFAVVVGETSKARKGTSMGHIYRLLESVDKEWNGNRIVSGLSSGEGLIWEVRDPIKQISSSKKQKDKEITIDPGVKDKRALVVEAEFASVLRNLERDGNTLSATIRNAWDTGKLSSLTKNSPARVSRAHVSIIGHITKGELIRYLNRTETGNGFGNRFLWVCVQRSKFLPDGGRIDEVNFTPILKKLSKAAKFAKEVVRVRHDKGASILWHKVYPELSCGKPGLLGAMTGRAEAQVTRLATLYAILDCSNQITENHLKAALSLWKYCEDSCSYIFGNATGFPLADEIFLALKNNPMGLTRTDLRDLFNRNKHTGQIEQALAHLLQQGVIRRTEDQNPGGIGRKAERWFAIIQTNGPTTETTIQ
jgi:hypothetical protein